jgi:hypothetical protein
MEPEVVGDADLDVGGRVAGQRKRCGDGRDENPRERQGGLRFVSGSRGARSIPLPGEAK